jgi:maltooligosyltrehalose trehalohydrolase
MPLNAKLDVGAVCLSNGGVRFRVWAPFCRSVHVELHGRERLPLLSSDEGWFEATVASVGPGTRYMYLLDAERWRPDPVSRALPEGVHGPSEVIDTSAFVWTDSGWRGPALKNLILYELHVGTFTPEGTFDAVIPRLPALRALGITAIELMPVASFPGVRNWGYDGVGVYAPQRSYGGPAGLQRFVNACHAIGLAVVLDVVYNHFGPEGNYLADFGPYFTDRYETPWGKAINYDGADAGPVRQFVVENACYWIREYHLDGLRLDAVHGIFDASPVHILRELNCTVHAEAVRLRRSVLVIAESDLNDRRVIIPVQEGGFGLDAQWSDDFHHALHALLTGEREGYYADFGTLEQLATAYASSFVFSGQHSTYRARPHGTPVVDLPVERFVICAQNHDQIGNRAEGDRLAALIPFDALKLAAAAVLLSPYIPLLFMGEEYGEPAPFQFFTDFEDPALQRAVRQGRQGEFKCFGWSAVIPDPQDPATFARSTLDWARRERMPHAHLMALYRALLSLRQAEPIFQPTGERPQAYPLSREVLLLTRAITEVASMLLLNVSPERGRVLLPFADGMWNRVLDTSEERYGGLGATSPAQVSGPQEVSVEVPAWGGWAYVRRTQHS